MKLENRTAVITGAASGIGRAIAVSLARRGCNLALADVNDADYQKRLVWPNQLKRIRETRPRQQPSCASPNITWTLQTVVQSQRSRKL